MRVWATEREVSHPEHSGRLNDLPYNSAGCSTNFPLQRKETPVCMQNTLGTRFTYVVVFKWPEHECKPTLQQRQMESFGLLGVTR